MKTKYMIEITVDDETEDIEYKFTSNSGGIKLRDFAYWTMEAISSIITGWTDDEVEN